MLDWLCIDNCDLSLALTKKIVAVSGVIKGNDKIINIQGFNTWNEVLPKFDPLIFLIIRKIRGLI